MYYRIIEVQLTTNITLREIKWERKWSMNANWGSTGGLLRARLPFCQKGLEETPKKYCMPRPQAGIWPRT